MRNFRGWVLCCFIAVVLSACVGRPIKSVDMTDVGVPLTQSEAATISIYTSKTFPNRPLNSNWRSRLLEVNGKPILGDYDVVRVAATKDVKLKFSCDYNFSINDSGIRDFVSEATFKVDKGRHYYAVVSGTRYSREQIKSFTKSTGACSVNELTTNNPFLDVGY